MKKNEENTLKIVSKWINGEAKGDYSITAFLWIFGMLCGTLIALATITAFFT